MHLLTRIACLAALVSSTACTTYRQARQKAFLDNFGEKQIANLWLDMEGRNITYDRAWVMLVNAIADVYEIEVLDKQSGYLRTAELKRPLLISYSTGAVVEHFVSSIKVRCTSTDPPQFKVMVESFEARDGQLVPMEWVFRKDEQILAQVRGILGAPEPPTAVAPTVWEKHTAVRVP